MNLNSFLEQKTLFYKKIDFDIIKKSWDILSQYVTLPYIIHIVGTNGKGSTGRFIADFLYQKNYTVLHYSSPHIIKFNERIWLNGSNIDDISLEIAHNTLQKILPKKYLDLLTYFEYTTLLALLLSDKKDFLVLEAGLGGEFDATNVVKNNLTIVPSIGLDHIEFLGSSIEDIAKTKLRSCDVAYIFGKGVPQEAKKATKNILQDKIKVELQTFDLKSFQVAEYLKDNLALAFSVLKYLNISYKELILPKLFGRFEYLKDNIIIDVGHNPLAATAIVKELQGKKVNLIYNSYKDKDFRSVLKILKPIIKQVYILPLDDKRVIEQTILEEVLEAYNIKFKNFVDIQDNEFYLVFGSFLVVEEFLKRFGKD